MTTPALNTEQHTLNGHCWRSHCHHHNVDEDRSGYLTCAGCWHTFPTKSALRRAYRWAVQIGPATFLAALLTPASRIRTCPLCSHDLYPAEEASR